MNKLITFLLLIPIGILAQTEENKPESEKVQDSIINETVKPLVTIDSVKIVTPQTTAADTSIKDALQKVEKTITKPICIAGDCENGSGTMNYPSGTYVGNWKDDLRHGQGTYKWTNGDVYKGNWVDDKRHGQGTYIWHDGSKYKGNYSHGIRSGYGIYYYTNGTIYEGTWQNNLKHGIANFYYKESVNIGGKYFNNEYVSNTGVTQESYIHKPK